MEQQPAILPPATEAALPEKPPTKAQIKRFLPQVLKDPQLKETISNLPLRSCVPGEADELPKDDLKQRRSQLQSSLRNPTQAVYTSPQYRPIWKALWKAIGDAGINTDQTLRQRLLATGGTFNFFYRNDSCPHWLPQGLPGNETPVTLFLMHEADSTQDEPGRLNVFKRNGPPLTTTLDREDIERRAKKEKEWLVGVFHGASGSGKTTTMLAAAVEVFGAEVVIHLHGFLVKKTIGGEIPKEENARNDTVHRAIVQALKDQLKPILGVPLKHSGGTVAIVLDEMGSYKPIVRGLCRVRGKLAGSIAELLEVEKVVFLCGGMGLDIAEGADRVASNQEDYFMIPHFGISVDHLSSWLRGSAAGPAGRLVSEWLDRNDTHLCRLANELLTNSRSALIAVKNLLNAVVQAGLKSLPQPSTIEHVITSQIQVAILTSIQEFQSLNGLKKVDPPLATKLVWRALALQMFAIKYDLRSDQGEESPARLLTHYGILTDTWASLKQEAVDAKRGVGEPRYRVQNALVTMGRLGFGKSPPSPGASFWGTWEDDTCDYFGSLARCALELKRGMQLNDSTVRLALRAGDPSQASRGFQYVDDADMDAMSEEEKRSLQWIEVIPKGFTPRWKFVSLTSRAQIHSRASKKALGKVLLELNRYVEHYDFVVLRNAPLSKYADVICINTMSKELWLVQCKYSSAVDGKTKVSWEKEMLKMEGSFTQELLHSLKLASARYFFSIAHPPDNMADPTMPPDFFQKHSPVHVLEHPHFEFGVSRPKFPILTILAQLTAESHEDLGSKGVETFVGAQMPEVAEASEDAETSEDGETSEDDEMVQVVAMSRDEKKNPSGRKRGREGEDE